MSDDATTIPVTKHAFDRSQGTPSVRQWKFNAFASGADVSESHRPMPKSASAVSAITMGTFEGPVRGTSRTLPAHRGIRDKIAHP